MKRYKRFMDGVKASDTLNQRLKELKEPKQKPVWVRYGAMAAALVLVFGLGWYGLNYLNTVVGPRMFTEAIEKERAAQPDIALAGPGESVEPAATRFAGRYEATENGTASSYLLPYIEYTEAGNPNRYEVAADWDIPADAYRRDMSREHIAYMLGGEDALSTHLDWDGYELSGWAAWYENGDFWGAYINGYAGELDHFTFAVTADQLPPTCFALPDVKEQNICGLMVAAVGYDSTASTRQVSFMKDGYGYRFDLTGTDRELAEQRVSRLVRLVAEDGLALTYTCPYCGGTFPFGTVHHDPAISAEPCYTCPDCGKTFVGDDWRAHVHSFTGAGESSAPAVSADPSYSAPAVSAEPSYTCPTCGEAIPAGTAHDCAMCDGYPVPHICEICGASYPAGTDHQCELCGYPLAPDTHVCEVCGQTIPVGVEHSHQQQRHQERHHGNHH